MNRREFLVATALLGVSSRVRAATSVRDVRVEVFGLFHPRALTVVNRGAGLVIASGTTRTIVRDTAPISAALQPSSLIRLQPSSLIRSSAFGRPLSSFSCHGLDGSATEFELAVPGRLHRLFRGRLDVSVAGDALIPIVTIDLDVATASVVAAELIVSTPIEALKAQALAARSYFVGARARHAGGRFCDTTHCQFLRDVPPADHPATRASAATTGRVLTYHSVPIEAMYSASCGGRTRTLADIGLRDDGRYPFFSVECAACLANAPQWQRVRPADAETLDFAAAADERRRLEIARREGWSSVPGPEFTATVDGDRVVLDGRGAGHGVGLCQRGAAAMAAQGASAADILAHYYPGCELRSI